MPPFAACGFAPMRRAPFGCQFGEVQSFKAPFASKKFLGVIALHPAFQQFYVLGMLRIYRGQMEYLVRPEGAFVRQPHRRTWAPSIPSAILSTTHGPARPRVASLFLLAHSSE